MRLILHASSPIALRTAPQTSITATTRSPARTASRVTEVLSMLGQTHNAAANPFSIPTASSATSLTSRPATDPVTQTMADTDSERHSTSRVTTIHWAVSHLPLPTGKLRVIRFERALPSVTVPPTARTVAKTAKMRCSAPFIQPSIHFVKLSGFARSNALLMSAGATSNTTSTVHSMNLYRMSNHAFQNVGSSPRGVSRLFQRRFGLKR